MTTVRDAPETYERLKGWKAIADALEVTPRAAQNYVKQGLRVAKTGRRVWAYRVWLQEFQTARTIVTGSQ